MPDINIGTYNSIVRCWKLKFVWLYIQVYFSLIGAYFQFYQIPRTDMLVLNYKNQKYSSIYANNICLQIHTSLPF